MNYNNKKLGEELKTQLEKGYDIVKISRWAYTFYSHNCRFLNSSTEEILEYLFRMEDDPQFEYTEQELWLLAELLINEVKDPIKQINDMKSKKLD
jgi:hypothetical protein